MHFKYSDIGKLKVEKIYCANTNQKQAGVAIWILDRVNQKSKKFTRNNDGHYIIIKESVHQEDNNFKCMFT